MAAGRTLRLRSAAFMSAAIASMAIICCTATNVIRPRHEVNHDSQEDTSALAGIGTINDSNSNAGAFISTSHLERTKTTVMRASDHPLAADVVDNLEAVMIGPSGQVETEKRAVILAQQLQAESGNVYVDDANVAAT